MNTKRSLILVSVLLGAVLGGCSTSPIKKWQAAVEEHVLERGHGDMNSIRMASAEGDRFDFVDRRAKLTEMFPSNRRDVHAVVLGRAEWRDELWQVFLLGVVRYTGMLDRFPLEAKEVEDIRLALARVGDGGEFVWIMGEADEESLGRYRDAQSDEAPAFPTASDRLLFEMQGQSVGAVDENSGAEWSIQLSGE